VLFIDGGHGKVAFMGMHTLDGLYPLRYFFWTWHCQHALVNTVHIPSHAIKVQHV
jgi:hypothetical protein